MPKLHLFPDFRTLCAKLPQGLINLRQTKNDGVASKSGQLKTLQVIYHTDKKLDLRSFFHLLKNEGEIVPHIVFDFPNMKF